MCWTANFPVELRNDELKKRKYSAGFDLVSMIQDFFINFLPT